MYRLAWYHLLTSSKEGKGQLSLSRLGKQVLFEGNVPTQLAKS